MAGKKGRSGRKKQEKGPKTITPAVGPQRDGGKSALMMEAKEIEARENPPEKEISEREKIDKKYMEQTYGTPESSEEEQTQEEAEEQEEETEEETEQEVEETSEETQQETSEEEQSSEAISPDQYRSAVDKMHEATTEAANQRKYIDEIGRFVDWEKYQQSLKGQTIEKKTEVKEEEVELPTLSSALEDEEKYHQTLIDAVAKRVAQKITPQVSNQVTEQVEEKEVLERYHKDFKELPHRERFIPLFVGIGQEEAKKDPTFLQKSYMERYEALLPEFRKTIAGIMTKPPGKKKVPVESPSKLKEREITEAEKPLTPEDVEKSNRNYVKFRAAENKRLQGLS